MRKDYKILKNAVLDLLYLCEQDYIPLNEHIILADCMETLNALAEEWGDKDG